MVDVTEPSSDAERAEQLALLRANSPIDIDGLIAGTLAGPASPDRPPVPVWEYPDYLAAHPELSIDALSQVRFPIVHYGGHTTVTSIAELIAPGPVPATFDLTPRDIVRLYRLQHEAGALRWNVDTLTHEETAPVETYRAAVYDRFRQELDARAPGPNP